MNPTAGPLCPSEEPACPEKNAVPAACRSHHREKILAHLRAPAEDGGVVAVPAPEEAASLLRKHAHARDGACGGTNFELFGRGWKEVAASAQADLRVAAFHYTKQYRDAAPAPADAPLVLAGHQPELFHPGVWAKNFYLAGLAKRTGGAAVNLVVDGDTVKQAAVSAPTLVDGRPRRATVAFDARSEELPAEERGIVDFDLLKSFPAAAAAVLAPLHADRGILAPALWPHVLERAQAVRKLGPALAQARHRLEGEWGLETWEFPLSASSDFPAFGLFAGGLLAHLPRFVEVHNRALGEYRRRWKVRSRNHPFPELAAEGEWLEAPFWTWRSESPVRKRLFVAGRPDHLLLTDREQWTARLEISPESAPERVEAEFARLAAAGVKIRTRALTTTLWARLFLGDLFLHGLGGAKYDRLTNVVVERFFGVPAPVFYTVTATCRLPLDRPAFSRDAIRRIDRRQRDLHWNPDRLLDDASRMRPEVQRLLGEREALLAVDVPPAEAAARHAGLRSIAAGLRPFVAAEGEKLAAERLRLHELELDLRALASREYSFCLHPEAVLRPFLTGLAKQAAGG